MIQYRLLTIEDYKSIKTASIDFTPGVFKVVGEVVGGDYSSNGAGKALWDEEPVLTPSGFTAIKNLQVGDYVVGSNGLPTEVLGVYPQGYRELYKVTFRDGSYSICDKEHRWAVQAGWKADAPTHILTVSELLQRGISTKSYDRRYDRHYETYKYSITLPEACEYGSREGLTLHPYLLGVLLGDGGFTGTISLTNKDRCLIDKAIKYLPEGTEVGQDYFREGAYHITFTGTLRYLLDELRLHGHKSIHKFIPESYMNSPLDFRKELVQGLIDTDGYVKDGQLLEFSSSSKQLAEDFLLLFRSLGKYATITSRKSGYRKKGVYHECETSYRVNEHKGKRQKAIVSIEPEGAALAKATCISVAAEDHLFVTRDFNCTHNSSLLQAMTVVLYNKDFQGAPIDTISNRETGKPFKITLLFSSTKAGNSSEFKVVNDRASKKIFVYKNGTLINSSAAKSVKLLQDIIGMSYETYKFTHYITTSSILDLTTNLSSATLFNEVLQVTDLKVMGKDLLEVKKVYKKEADELHKEYQELTGINKLLKVTNQYDLVDLKEQEEALTNSLRELEEIHKDHIAPKELHINALNDEITSLSRELSELQRTLSKGSCTLCGSTLTSVEIQQKIRDDIISTTSSITTLEEELYTTQEKLSGLSVQYLLERTTLENDRNSCRDKINTGEQLLVIHEEVLQDSGKFTPEHYEAIKDRKRYLFKLIDHIDAMRNAITSGKIYEEVMNEFFTLVNINIQQYAKVINFNVYTIEATSYRSGLLVLLKKGGKEIPVESLSNGEKSRLGLLLLSAIIESMSMVTNAQANLLSIDESTSSFDKSGILELAALFQHLKVLGQSIFIITHGSELDKVKFDGTLIVHKEALSSTISFIKDTL